MKQYLAIHEAGHAVVSHVDDQFNFATLHKCHYKSSVQPVWAVSGLAATWLNIGGGHAEIMQSAKEDWYLESNDGKYPVDAAIVAESVAILKANWALLIYAAHEIYKTEFVCDTQLRSILPNLEHFLKVRHAKI